MSTRTLSKNGSLVKDLPLPVPGLDLRADLALIIPTPASPAEVEALEWFLSQRPDETMRAIVDAHENAIYWQQRDAQSMLDGAW